VGHGQDEAEDGCCDEDACLEAANGCSACGGLDDDGEVGVDRVLGVRADRDSFLRGGGAVASIIIPTISVQYSDSCHKKSLSIKHASITNWMGGIAAELAPVCARR
jgi:hypothetical protein